MSKDKKTLNKPKFSEFLKVENCESTDLIQFMQRLSQFTPDRGLLTQELGNVGSDPILLLKPKISNDGPNLLIAAGFHGEESAGPWGILYFLKNFPQDLFNSSNLSFIPVVNPTGFRQGKHTNMLGEDPNRGFCHNNSGKLELSQEGLILMENLLILKSLAKDGFISLHEDIELEHFYLYTFENSETPGSFSKALCTAENNFFEPPPDGIIEGGSVRNGIIFRYCDGSFEDLLFHEGIPRTACTETPGLFDIDKRVEANSNIISAFVRFTIAVYG